MLDPGKQSSTAKARQGQTLTNLETRLLKLERALDLESSLERIRSHTMVMEHTDDLAGVIRQAFQEAIDLGFGAKACDLVILDRKTGSSQFWISGELDEDEVIHFHVPKLRVKHYQEGFEAWKRRRGVRYQHLKGRSCRAYMRHLTDYMEQSNMPKKVVRMLRELTSIHHTEAYMRYGFFRVASDGLLDKDQIKILRRFARVCEQSYTRFLDLQKAEAQARESQIEAALERVRTRTMAMQHSDELSETSFLLAKQVRDLGIKAWGCAFHIYADDENGDYEWFSNEDGYLPFYKTPRKKFFKTFYDKLESGETLYIQEFKDRACAKHYDYLMSLPVVGEALKEMKDSGIPLPTSQIDHVVYFKHGYLLFITYEQVPEAHHIFKRFAREFEQTYVRYLDLKKAEEQAREAQIEAALERVRAAAVAMQHSSEMQNVVAITFEQLQSLQLPIDGCQIVNFDDDTKDLKFWSATPDMVYPVRIEVPYLNNPVFTRFWEAKDNGDSFTSFKVSRPETLKFYEHVYHTTELGTTVTKKRWRNIQSMKYGFSTSWSIQKNTGFFIFNFQDHEFSEEENSIIVRFSTAFEQSYTRFLDLQKAEAQTREAQIEAALERVRAASMAMHHTSELQKVINTVGEQFQSLQIENTGGVFISINDELEDEICVWGSGATADYVQKVCIPVLDRPIYTEIVKRFKEGPGFVTESFSRVEKLEFFRHMFKYPPYNQTSKAHQKEWLAREGGYTRSCVISKHTSLFMINHHGRIFSDEENDIVKRFGRVFEQSYVRFLDLQKAEAQAREAQIEAALERVRSSSLAMHQTSDIAQVVTVLFDQLKALELDFIQTWITIFELDQKQINVWFSQYQGVNEEPVCIVFPSEVFAESIEAWQDGVPFWYRKFATREEIDAFLTACSQVAQTDYFNKINEVIDVPCLEFIEARHEFGNICKSGIAKPTADEKVLLQRFGRVFEQAYTRFLDLQKAEAQAREAQIEAALERVRASSLAMHRSDDMQLVVNAVYEQIQALGIETDAVGMSGVIKSQSDYDVWVGGSEFSKPLRIPFNDATQVQRDYNEIIEKRQPIFARTYSGKVKQEYIDHLISHGDIPNKLKRRMLESKAFSTSISFCQNSGIQIVRYNDQPYTDHENEILLRFARVFEQAYIRFLDLQKAEASAREAQIEAALERLRARSMAMHQSDELKEVVVQLFEGLDHLGIDATVCNVALFDKETREAELWTAHQTKKGLTSYHVHVPWINHAFWKGIYDSFEKGHRFAVHEVSTSRRKGFSKIFFEKVDYSHAPKEVQKANEELPDSTEAVVLSVSAMKHGLLVASRNCPLAQEEGDILTRFAKVFEQAYTRFLDLKKAEAQAREAEIETSLERVRSRTMAMHKSDELLEIVHVVHDELVSLGLDLDVMQIYENQPGRQLFKSWMAIPGRPYPAEIIFPYFNHPWLEEVILTQRKQRTLARVLQKRSKNAFYRKYFKVASIAPSPERQKLILDAPAVTSVFTFCRNTGLAVIRFREQEFTSEQISILERFAAVFEQSFTRFLDLQKAEAQAREAQIEAALERVRARSMAMHKSEELNQVIATVFDQLQTLGFEAIHCEIILFDPQTLDCEIWPSNEAQQILPRSYFIPHTHHAFYQFLVKAWQTRSDYHPYELKGRVKSAYEKWLFNQTDWQHIPADVKQSMLAIKKVMLYGATMRHGILEVASQKTLSVENFKIIRRFAKVFEQVYTRFLDLQKAEAQAREAEIQLALERIRARSLAMHQSEELTDVISELFKQFDILDINPAFAHLTLFDGGDESFTLRLTDTSGDRVMAQQRIRLKHMPEWIEAYQAWKEGKPGQVVIIRYRPEDLPYVFGLLKDLIKAMPAKTRIQTKKYPDGLWTVQGHCQFGYLGMNIARPPTEEDKDIVRRFAREFGRVYQRFIDLQNAEAQAREAQIQTALERVRAAAMAMHHSDDLINVAKVLREQMGQLGQPELESSIIHLYPEGGDTIEAWWVFRPPDDTEGQVKEGTAYILSKRTAWSRAVMRHYLSDQSEYTIASKGKMLREWYHQLEETAPSTIEYDSDGRIKVPDQLFYHFSKFSGGALLLITSDEPDKESCELQRRAAAVFDLAYTRFLDLKKAEAQAREAQIEAALERVRSKTMAMYRSEQLPDTASVVFEQLFLLGNVPDRICITIFKEEEGLAQFYVTDQAGSEVSHVFDFSIDEPTTIRKIYIAWKRKEESVRVKLTGRELEDWIRYVVDDVGIFIDESNITGIRFHQAAFFSQGFLLLTTHEPIDDSLSQLLIRFAKVFDQTYTRFLDLKKAEAQAREAQIEAALERVRARTMAMHDSQDIGDTVVALFDELVGLGISEKVRCGIGIMDDTEVMELWTASNRGGTEVELNIGYLDMSIHPLLQGARQAWKDKKESFLYELRGDDMIRYFEAINSAPDYPVTVDLETLTPLVVHQSFMFPNGLLYAFSEEHLPDDVSSTLKRFAAVFGQTYQRYIDLQNAEAQAREAQIEAALERVRSRSMAMQKSDEVNDVISVLFRQFDTLGLNPKFAHLSLYSDDGVATARMTDTSGERVMAEAAVPLDAYPEWKESYHQWKEAEENSIQIMEYKPEVLPYVFGLMQDVLEKMPEEHRIDPHGFPNGMVTVQGHCRFGYLGMNIERKPTEEEKSIVARFAREFGRIYQRVLDLEKAEAQAREAQIEASLERVRSRSMAMQSSDELQDVLSVLFQQYDVLDIHPVNVFLTLFDLENDRFIYRASGKGGVRAIGQQIVDLSATDIWDEVVEKFKNEKSDAAELIHYPKESLPAIFEIFHEAFTAVPEEHQIRPEDFPDGIYTTHGHFEHGYLGINHTRPATMEEEEIIARFSTEFGRVYRRFLDLQLAEAQARESLKQAALDRVQGEIASMRHAEDLNRITPVIWRELIALEVPFIRCGVFIVAETSEEVQAFLSTPDGKALGVLHLQFDLNEQTTNIVRNWKEKEVYTEHWDAERFIQWTNSMVELGQIQNVETYRGATKVPESLYLHFVPFRQGMLYVGDSHPLQEDKIALVKTLAEAFSVAYARYEDFTQLETAKERVENTLDELKATQNQLIHAEKMASLGELTAGIAHEIQNPLNFVNNFSDVNSELIEEMLEEIKAGNFEEAVEIARDIEGNEQKIKHHGKRAEAIVRSMLQHSRSSSTQKELTDINDLVDEYLRLAYHGMRAKDKSFNASMKTDFDKSLNKIEVVPQEIGRVLLNLITNAFHAVNEKKMNGENGYDPEVLVATRKLDGKLLISVKDNGGGIPRRILDKIFQPFFTTKPTGQGTGLGLSLSYDIVKVHNGDLKVETKEGEGTEFIVELPMV